MGFTGLQEWVYGVLYICYVHVLTLIVFASCLLVHSGLKLCKKYFYCIKPVMVTKVCEYTDAD